jgi:hypothetical protein
MVKAEAKQVASRKRAGLGSLLASLERSCLRHTKFLAWLFLYQNVEEIFQVHILIIVGRLQQYENITHSVQTQVKDILEADGTELRK